MPADRKTYLADVTAILRRQWPDHRRVNIVCHGHSVPAGYFATPVIDTFNSYPHLLHEGLRHRFPFSILNVVVTAIGREHSESGALRFETEVLLHRPDVVTIDYGLNDRRIGLGIARAAWISMIEKAKARGVKVLLLTPTADVTQRTGAPLEERLPLQQHAEQIRQLASEYEVGLVDSLAAFDQYQRESGDLSSLLSVSNHPNRAGHELVVRELLLWFPIVPKLEDAQGRIQTCAAGRRIGTAIGEPEEIGAMVVQKFSGGADTEGECAVVDSPRRTWLVRNDFYRNWRPLEHGAPTEDERVVGNGAEQKFERVLMTWWPERGTQITVAWWLKPTPFQVRAGQICAIYDAPGGRVTRTLTDRRVMEVSEARPDGWLLVFRQPAMWVRAEQVVPV